MRHLMVSLLLLAGSAFAAPIAGTWKVAGDVQGYPIREVCTFTGDDSALTGSCAGEKTYPATVARKSEMVTITHAGEYEGQALTLTFTGKILSDGSLSGTIDVQPLNYDGTFTATRDTSVTAKP